MLDLCLHPSETRKPRHKIRASARRIAGSDLVTLRFESEGVANVVCAAPKPDMKIERLDELWKSTCLECFLGGSSPSYQEWNFAPNGNWAAYDFDEYRKDMQPAEVDAPSLHRTSTGDRARFEIDISLCEELTTGILQLGLTAVIIEKSSDGVLTADSAKPFYWALSHNGPKPDFHLRESFTLELGT